MQDFKQLPNETLAVLFGIDLEAIRTATDAELIAIAYPKKAEGKKS